MKIAIFCSDPSEFYYRSLIGAVTKRAHSEGHETTVIGINALPKNPEDNVPENRLLALLDNGGIDASIFLTDAAFHPAAMDRLADKQDLTWVSIGKMGRHTPAVAIDNLAALPTLMSHLYDHHGYRDFLFLFGPDSSEDARERSLFFHHYMEARAGKVRWAVSVCDFLEKKAFEAVIAFFRSEAAFRPQVIVASNDNMAFGAVRALRALGVSCPEECAVTGFDDVEEAAYEFPSLTTIRQPQDELARQALEALVRPRAPENQLPKVVPTLLIKRESCGCKSALTTVRDYRIALSRIQNKRIQAEAFLGASASFGVRVNAALDLDALVSDIEELCQFQVPHHLMLALVAEDSPPLPTGIPTRWKQVYRFSVGSGDRTEKIVSLAEIVFPLESLPSPTQVHTVSLLFAGKEVLGLLGCCLPIEGTGFLRLLTSNLSLGLSRVFRWKTLVSHTESLEISVEQRNRDLTVAIGALHQENIRKKALEKALKAERSALQDILEAQPTALVVLSAKGHRIRYFNRPFARLVGIGDHERLPPPDFLSNDYGPLLSGLGPWADQGRELLIPDRTGGNVPVLMERTELILRGEPTVLVGMMDLSQQKLLEKDLLNISENERRKFGQEIHDDICQRLATLSIYASIVDRKILERFGERLQAVPELETLSRAILERVRSLSRGLFPSEIGSLPLPQLFEHLLNQVQQQTGLIYQWDTNLGDRPSRLDPNDELHLFRILQESILNTLKHSQATSFTVRLTDLGHKLVLQYSDDGVGPGSSLQEGVGLRSLRYRASQIGAHLSWGPGSSGGISLRLEVPMKVKEE
jgi:DNA-binding LacI/PurR family transcriptional regulator/signal transduction histidine kinase